MELSPSTIQILEQLSVPKSNWGTIQNILTRPDFLLSACGRNHDDKEENLLTRAQIISSSPGATPQLITQAFDVRSELQKFTPLIPRIPSTKTSLSK